MLYFQETNQACRGTCEKGREKAAGKDQKTRRAETVEEHDEGENQRAAAEAPEDIRH